MPSVSLWLIQKPQVCSTLFLDGSYIGYLVTLASGTRIVAEEKSNQWPIRPISLYPRTDHFESPATSSLKMGWAKSSIWRAAQRLRFAAAVFQEISPFVMALMAAMDSNPYVRREHFRLQPRSRKTQKGLARQKPQPWLRLLPRYAFVFSSPCNVSA